MRPRGLFLIARSGGRPVGCVALKGAGEGMAEVKRLWIDPAMRGAGVARALMRAVEDGARGLGIAILRLDTNRAQAQALAFYRTAGWTEIARFNDDPYADHFFEKRLVAPI